MHFKYVLDVTKPAFREYGMLNVSLILITFMYYDICIFFNKIPTTTKGSADKIFFHSGGRW